MYSSSDFLKDIKCAPFIRITIPLMLGVVVQYKSALNVNGLFFVIPLLLSLLLFVLFKASKQYSKAWIYGLHYYLLLFFAGICLVQARPQQSAIPLGEKVFCRFVVTDNPKINEKSIGLSVKINAFSVDGEKWEKCKEKSIVYVSKNDNVNISAGDEMLCKAVFNEINSIRNPEEFNYKEYLAMRKIFSSSFINTNDIAKIDSAQISVYKKAVLNIQDYAHNALSQAGLGNDELSVAIALLIGNKQYLDDDLRQAYVSSGTIHVLAVSGLHVGIIFMILSFLLQFMNRNNKTRIAKGFIILLSLWAYASIAGLAPSICRAALMFSVFVVADMTGRTKNTYNNIAFSCFVLTIINPLIIFDVGFQLSYSAVLGIVFFQPKFMKLLESRSKLVNAITGCLTVTLAAQLATLPIILYTYKLFPIYFLISNLIIVPIIPFVMYLGLMTITTSAIISWTSLIFEIFGVIFNLSIKSMNFFVKTIESLPGSVADGIYINSAQCLMLCACVLFLALIFAFRNIVFTKLLLVTLIGVFTIRAIHLYDISAQKEFGVFNTGKPFYAFFIKPQQSFALSDTQTTAFDYNTKNYLIKKGFKSEKDLHLYILTDSIPESYKGIVLFSGLRIGILSQLEINNNYNETPFDLDYLYVTESINPETVLKCYNPAEIYLSNNLPGYIANEWANTKESLKSFWKLSIEQ